MKSNEQIVREAIERGMSNTLSEFETGRQPHDRNLARPFQRALKALDRLVEERDSAERNA